MNRNKVPYYSVQNNTRVSKQIIIHEAGHAAAIYLNNKEKKLPPVFFKILLNTKVNKQENQPILCRTDEGEYLAKIEGGRLIQSFLQPSEITNDYITAFETDIVNILIGPLAEAKYIHHCDDEFFGRLLVNINTLNFYGGQLDLALVSDYLQSLYPSKQQQQEKLDQLFFKAFEFIDNDNNWQAITNLTDYIYEKNKSVIYFEELASILEPMKLELMDLSNY